ncbi:MAG: ATP-binding protein [Bacteroidota bacterium]
MIRNINKQDILTSFNFWAIVVCLFFVVFLTVFVEYSEHYFYFIIGAVLFIINQYLISKGRLKIAFIIFVLCTNSIMLIFDAGIMSPTRGFVFYIPLLLCNLIITNFDNRLPRLFAIMLTVTCISLTTFTDLTPKIAAHLYEVEHQVIVSYFNTFIAIFMAVMIAYVLSRSSQKAEENLQESKKILSQNEKLLNSINQNIDVAICRTDLVSNSLVYANNANAKVFGYDSLDELLKVCPDDFYIDMEERNRVVTILEKEGFVSNMEVKYKRKDGSAFWGLLTSNKTIDANGNVMYDGALRDISEVKNLQEELIAAKESAEKSSLAKSQFLSTMSHEIRTPMNAVIGASNLLLQDETRPEQIENLQLLKSAGSNLMRLINNVLDFSKIELDKVEFEQVSVDLYQLMEETISAHTLEAQKKGIILEFETDRPSYPYVLDPIRFIQIINNLMSNAVKFTDEGQVTISIKIVEESLEMDTLTIAVKDTGIGIAADRQDKIFDSFSQENIDTTRRYGGSGLGLAITRRIIQKLNSAIDLKSEKGKGSTFSFTLQLKKHEQPQQPQPIHEYADRSLEGMRILMVEDNKMNTLIMMKFLSRWNVLCDSCESGDEALKKLKQNNYELVLMDLHMPEMDGFQTTKIIRSFNTEIPIFALTADAFAETRIKALACGMNDFISKPFDPVSLFNKIAHVRVLHSAKYN